MTLREYFRDAEGFGVLSTADSGGAVDAAMYSKPHIMDDGTVAFVMRGRLTHHNLRSNPRACYLFLERGPGYRGIRLFLKKVKEETDPAAIEPLMRRRLSPEEDRQKGATYLVAFSVEKILPLQGSGEPSATSVV